MYSTSKLAKMDIIQVNNKNSLVSKNTYIIKVIIFKLNCILNLSFKAVYNSIKLTDLLDSSLLRYSI